MVFDNASCPEVVNYLQELKKAENIQFLILSDKNLGKVGAWNIIFGAAQGEYVAYSDGDVYYYPEWLPAHMKIFETFPEVGTVAGLPRRGRRKFYKNTIKRAAELPNATFEEGHFIPDEWIVEHAQSLGKLDQVQKDLEKADYRLTREGVSAYATATHFQFMVRTSTIKPFLPLAYDRPMGESVANFDRAIDENNLLRLAVSKRVVKHLGNTLDENTLADIPDILKDPKYTLSNAASRGPARSAHPTIFAWTPIRRLLLGIYDRIFRLYFGGRR
jgi:glycosyltransferase involved in cell wall biosynthesis